MVRRSALCLGVVLVSCTLMFRPAVHGQQVKSSDPVLVTVNGQSIRESQVRRLLEMRHIPAKSQEQARTAFLNELVDSEVIRQFLADRNALPTKPELDAAVKEFKALTTKGSKNPDQALIAAGYTDEVLRDQVMLPLAWQKHVERVFTNTTITEYFARHREQFDGTQVRARHVFLKVATGKPSPELAAAEQKLAGIRQQILAGNLSFEEAAQKYSEGPSASRGGDVGFFAWRGKMPESFSKVAFKLKPKEISEPFQSQFGVHICTLIERKPGTVEPEDVREQVLRQMAQELWTKTAGELRAKAKLDWKTKS